MLQGIKLGTITLGCSKNRVDTENMLGLLLKNNVIMTGKVEEADVLLINTCGFIDQAKDESIETILEHAQYKTKGSCKALIIAGCMAVKYKEKLMEEIPEIDAIIGPGEVTSIHTVIKDALSGKKTVKATNASYTGDSERFLTTNNFSVYLKIADGCDHKCTYCIIPSLRGEYHSRSIDSIVKETKILAAGGAKEINLVAQDLTYYGKEQAKVSKLSNLLDKLSDIKSIEWIRLLYGHPAHLDKKTINVIAKQKNICKYIDIPFQHISDNILNRMGRPENSNKIKNVIEDLRSKVPGIVIRSSFIVGFPGETEEDFQILLAFLKEYLLDRVGIFKYSLEEGTASYHMENHIAKEVKEERYNIAMELLNEISEKNNKHMLGKTEKVLVERMVSDNLFAGRYYGQAPEIDGEVYIKEVKKCKIGSFVPVKITGYTDYDLLGEETDGLS